MDIKADSVETKREVEVKESKIRGNVAIIIAIVILALATIFHMVRITELQKQNDAMTVMMYQTELKVSGFEGRLSDAEEELYQNTDITIKLCRYLGLGY